MAQSALMERDITLQEKALSYPEKAKQLTIDNPGDYAAAGFFVKTVDLMVKEVESTFKPLVDEAHRHHKSLIAEMNRHLDPLQTAKTMARTLMISWDREQERIRREEEMRLQAIARRREEEAKIQEALAAEAAGEKEVAEAIMQEEVYVPPVILQKQVPKIQGVVFRTRWKFRVKDASKLPTAYLTPDMVKIGAVVRAMKANHGISGVEAYEERV